MQFSGRNIIITKNLFCIYYLQTIFLLFNLIKRCDISEKSEISNEILSGVCPYLSREAARRPAARAEQRARAVEAPVLGRLAFDPDADLIFDYGPALSGHANGLILKGTDGQGDVITQMTYYSIGGGFVVVEERKNAKKKHVLFNAMPYPIQKGAQLLAYCKES